MSKMFDFGDVKYEVNISKHFKDRFGTRSKYDGTLNDFLDRLNYLIDRSPNTLSYIENVIELGEPFIFEDKFSGATVVMTLKQEFELITYWEDEMDEKFKLREGNQMIIVFKNQIHYGKWLHHSFVQLDPEKECEE